MKKGKAKTYVKKKSSRDKYMTYLVIGVMVFSGLWFGLRSAEEGVNGGGGTETLKLQQYSVTQLGDGMIAVLVEERPEVVALVGERANLDIDTITGIMNLSVKGVYDIDGEIAVNSYVFFRFYTTSMRESVDDLEPKLDGILGDYSLYRGYTGVTPGDTSMENQMYLLGSLNLTKGTLTRVILMEKRGSQGSLGYVGFVKDVIPYGPVVDGKVKTVEGLFVSGASQSGDLIGAINESIPGIMQMDYAGGVLRLALPLDANLSLVDEILSEKGVANVTERAYGRVTLPKEVVINNMLVPIDNSGDFKAILFKNASAGGEVKIRLDVVGSDEQYTVSAVQVNA